jgi:hypothetical protein
VPPYVGLPDVTYPTHDRDVLVSARGRIGMMKKINSATVLAIGKSKQAGSTTATGASAFATYDLGQIDDAGDPANPRRPVRRTGSAARINYTAPFSAGQTNEGLVEPRGIEPLTS